MEGYTVEEVQDYILTDAEDFANERLLEESGDTTSPLYGIVEPGRAYRADPIQSERGGLCLTFDPSFTMSRSPEQIERLHDIGRRAIKQALVKNHDQFVGVILGEARAGRNYFERFESDDHQYRLF